MTYLIYHNNFPILMQTVSNINVVVLLTTFVMIVVVINVIDVVLFSRWGRGNQIYGIKIVNKYTFYFYYIVYSSTLSTSYKQQVC